MSKRLPVIQQGRGSIREDGSRIRIVPAEVHGRFQRLRAALVVVLVGIYVALPFVQVAGRPAVHLSLARRELYLFGGSFSAQDTWLAFFAVSGIAFVLVVLAALLGRVWCGYACPQTVFVDGIVRRIERLVEGPRAAQLKRDAGPMTISRLSRKIVKLSLFAALAFALAHVMLAYFVTAPGVLSLVGAAPRLHIGEFTVTMALAGVLFFDFAWFREQLCLVICPYGRLQSALADEDSLIVGYDEKRGEPRKHGKDREGGDCVDCSRCVQVCPTGIDIRNGQQLDCIGCAACIDACDEVMLKVGKPAGLVRYDSANGLRKQPRRFFRPRLALYGALGIAGLIAASVAIASREPFEANILRPAGAPFVLEGGLVRNAFELHLTSKQPIVREFTLEVVEPAGAVVTLPSDHVELAPMDERHLPFFVSLPEGHTAGARVTVRVSMGEESIDVRAPFLGPTR